MTQSEADTISGSLAAKRSQLQPAPVSGSGSGRDEMAADKRNGHWRDERHWHDEWHWRDETASGQKNGNWRDERQRTKERHWHDEWALA